MKQVRLLVIFLFMHLGGLFAQGIVKGVVVDANDGLPVIGANVLVLGTSEGTVTNLDGQFSLEITKKVAQIQVSFIGYQDQMVRVKPGSNIKVSLKTESVEIDNVVVTGFKKAKKETFTGSAVKVDASQINMKGVTDVSRMLEGQVAGVSVQNVSSTFGSAPKVRVRGVTSLSGENKPLWVVDGVVLEDVVNISNDQLSSGDPTTLLGSSVAGINSSDIESFDILKDAAATALYGARAMNGVVVITTKKGVQGKPRVNYSTNLTWREKPSYQNYDVLNSAEQMAIYAELERKGLLNQDIVNHANSGVYGIMYNAINQYDPETGFGLVNTAAARNAFLMDYALANTDWFDELFTNNLMQEHTLSVSTGSEKSRTYASVGVLDDAGWTVADRVSRYTFNLRNDYDVNERLSIGMQAVASLRQQEAPGSYGRSMDAFTGEWSRDFDINPFSYALNTSRAMRPYNNAGGLEYVTMNYAPFNILNELDNNEIKLNVIDTKLQGTLDYRLSKHLSFNGTGMMRYVKSDQLHRITENSNVSEAYRADYNSTIRERNPYLWQDQENPNIEPQSVLTRGGFYNTTNYTLLNYEARGSFAYNRIWYGNMNKELSILAGTQVKYLERTEEAAIQPGYQYEMGGVVYNNPLFYQMMSERQLDLFSSNIFRDCFAAFYANADLAIDRRYSVSGTIRYDGSNALGSDASSRWLPTWNVGGKWNIHNEAIFEDQTLINQLSIRASYGLNASMPSISNAAAVYRNTQIYRPGYTENQITIASLANQELTWEKSYQANVGLDLGLFENRLTLSLDYFDRQSFDLISVVKTSGIGGEMWKYANYADLDAHGYDITLGATFVRTKNWGLNANVTFGYATNTIKNTKDLPMVSSLVRVEGGNQEGYPVNSLFSIPFSRLDPQTGVPLFIGPDGEETHDIYMQGKETDFLKYEGSIDPKYTGGLNISARYKNFSLNTFFTYQGGNKLRLTPAYKATYSDLDAMPAEFVDRFLMTGDDLSPAITDWVHQSVTLDQAGFPYVNYNYSDARVVDGGFVRLKNVSVNYDLPQAKLARSKFIKSGSIRLTVKDPWLIYADPALNGQDPEFFNTGGVAMPTTRQYTVTLNLGF